MQVRGTLKMIGAGTFRSGVTLVSVLDIGDHSIRNVWIGNYLTNYLKIDDELTLLVLRILGHRSLCGLRTASGRTFMEGRFRNGLFLILLPFFGLFPLGVLYAIHATRVSNIVTLALTLLCLLSIVLSFGKCAAYIKFKMAA